MPMKTWNVEFDRVESYDIEVEAETAEEAEVIAAALVSEDPEAYLIDDAGLECISVDEV